MIFAIIGIVFNSLLMAVVVLSKELHHRRVFIWLGIGISNILVLSSHMLISQSVVRGSSFSERSLCYWFVILSIVVQMFNVFYAALERHFCINYTKLHSTAVFSTFSIILVQLTSYIPIFVLVILNWINFEGLSQPLHFGSYWHFKLVCGVLFGLLPFFLCGHLALTKPKTNRDEPSLETGNQQPHLNHRKATDQTTSKILTVLTRDNETSQLDFEAAKNFYFFVKLHFIFMALKLIPFVRILICLESKQVLPLGNQAPGSEVECFTDIKAFFFASAFLDCFYSSIANPAAFLLFILFKESKTINTDEKQHTTELL